MKQLHISGVENYLFCGESFRRKYIENEQTASSIALTIGSTVHDLVSRNISNFIDNGKYFEADENLDLATEIFQGRIKESQIMYTKKEIEWGIANAHSKAEENARQLSNLYVEEVLPMFTPVATEKTFVLTWNDDTSLAGTIDIVTEDGSIRDIKTSKAKPSANVINKSLQLSMYSFAYYKEFGNYPTSVFLDYLIKTKTPKVEILEGQRGEADSNRLITVIDTVLESIKKGIFLPASGSSFLCSPVYCDFYNTCKFV